MTDAKSDWENLKTEEELLTGGWSLHTTGCHHVAAGILRERLSFDNPELEFMIAKGEDKWEVKIMSRAKE